MEKDRLLSHLSGDDRRMADRVLDQAKACLEKAGPVATDFFDPSQQELVREVLHYLQEIKALTFGGYRRAERQRFVLVPAYYLAESIQPPLAFLSIKPLAPSTLAHRDYLGSILGLGLKREKIGDLLVSDLEAQVIIADEVREFLLSHLEKVGSVAVQVGEIDQEQLNIPPERVKEIKTTVASLRLDTVAGFGFGLSRTRMAREIKAEKVKVNWRPVSNPASPVKVGDIISMRGRGRVILEETTGRTKKDRIGLVLKRLF